MDRLGADRGQCPDCGCEVEVRELAAPVAPTPVPTMVAERSKAPRLPSSLLVVRDRPAPPPPEAPVAMGPFRTAGLRHRVERAPGSLAIVGFPYDRSILVGAAMVVGAPLAILVFGVWSMPVAFVGGGVGAWMLGVRARRRRLFELTAHALIVRTPILRRTLPRAAITHLYCVPLRDGARVEVIAGGERLPLVVTDLDDARGIAELLAHELGLPTWKAPDAT